LAAPAVPAAGFVIVASAFRQDIPMKTRSFPPMLRMQRWRCPGGVHHRRPDIAQGHQFRGKQSVRAFETDVF